MLVRDEQALDRLAQEAMVEKYMDDLKAYYARTHSQAVWIDTPDDPTNADRAARGCLTEEFEKRLLKLNKNLQFKTLPLKPDKRVCYVWRLGKAIALCVYENPWIPEFSLRARETEIEFNPTPFFNPDNRNASGQQAVMHINRKDMPKSEWDPEKGETIFHGLLPGEEEVELPWREVKRGWRTVLLYLLAAGELFLGDVEREFGSADTRGWRVATGRDQTGMEAPA
jgi:hypothetical protein